ncbi:hypothetical protein TrispH2_005802 [Trichoplax sp. H2]|nr:hypothetical protein TrispH2_005802 [Trichoplax sp. H2]|eukprot:RDD41908.1 hypothetical protein TrispH2_005802 [Trichoplax sp. H2]
MADSITLVFDVNMYSIDSSIIFDLDELLTWTIYRNSKVYKLQRSILLLLITLARESKDNGSAICTTSKL